MTRLTSDAMREIAGKVFVERSMTLTQAGAAYEMDELTSTVQSLRKLLRPALASLPNTAFAAQPDAEGEAAWSAGQVVAHLANSQASMSCAVRGLLEMQDAASNGTVYDMATLPTQAEALSILTTTESGFDAFVAEIPDDADTTKTMTHERFGEMSAKGWMLLMALHEADHLRQVGSLA